MVDAFVNLVCHAMKMHVHSQERERERTFTQDANKETPEHFLQHGLFQTSVQAKPVPRKQHAKGCVSRRRQHQSCKVHIWIVERAAPEEFWV